MGGTAVVERDRRTEVEARSGAVQRFEKRRDGRREVRTGASAERGEEIGVNRKVVSLTNGVSVRPL
jgi:hypothetical protein